MMEMNNSSINATESFSNNASNDFTQVWKGVFCTFIALVLTLPVLFWGGNYICVKFFGVNVVTEPSLGGAIEDISFPSITKENVLSGKFGQDYESFFAYNLTGRLMLTRVYNQLLLSAFFSTDSKKSLMGRDGYIFERSYPKSLFNEVDDNIKEILHSNFAILEKLGDALHKRGIAFTVYVSPGKQDYYKEYFPSSYDRFIKMKSEGKYAENYYEYFNLIKENYKFPVIDNISQLAESKESILFTKSGNHWSLPCIDMYVNEISASIEQQTGKKVGRLTVDSAENRPLEEYLYDDADLSYVNSTIKRYLSGSYPWLSYGTQNTEFKPSVYICGNSFNWQLLATVFACSEAFNSDTVINSQNFDPIWGDTQFSYYNSSVWSYSDPYGERTKIAETTKDYENILKKDAVIIQFSSAAIHSPNQIDFAQNLLDYINSIECEDNR